MKNTNQQKVEPVIKARPRFLYYNIRGLGQSIRNLLYYLNIDFENVKIRRGDEESKKYESTFNLFDAGLPIFEDQYESISHCVAIAKYVCARYGGKRLLGYSRESRSKITEVLYKYCQEINKIMPYIISLVVKAYALEGNAKKSYIKQVLKKLSTESRFLSYCLAQHRSTGKWVMSQLTLLDFHFYETCFYICGFWKKEIEECEELRGFLTFAQLFHTLGIRDHESKKKQEAGVFLLFKNQRMKEAVANTWQDNKQLLFVV